MSTSKFALGLLIAVAMAAGVVGLFLSHTSAQQTRDIHLAQGWNLVGWTGEKQSASEALVAWRLYNLRDAVLAVYGYNNDSQSFTRYIVGRPDISTLTDFEPEQAYWVLAQAATDWLVPGPAEPSCPTATPCPDCLSASDLLSEFCVHLKVKIETGEVLLEIAEAGLLVGKTETEVRTELALHQEAFDEGCQGVPLAQPLLLAADCAYVGWWKGLEDREMLYAPDPQTQIWADQFDSIIDKYCESD